MGKPRAVGSRGSWFAEVLGISLPCVSDQWLTNRHYSDPGARPGSSKWDKYIAAITGGRVILTHTEAGPTGRSARKGYIAVFLVDNVRLTSAGLEFDLIKRVLSLA